MNNNNTTKHSKGEWKSKYVFAGGGKNPDIEIYTTKGHHIGILPRQGDQEQQEADAELIVAAPELLEALKNMTSKFNIDASNYGFVKKSDIIKCKDAIAKAEGRG